MKALQSFVIILVFGWVCGVVEARAAAKISLNPVSEGVYSVTAVNVAKAASLDFTIPYNSATLSNPVITDGPFATTIGATRVASDDSKRGVLRVVYVVTANSAYFEGSGLLATVRFTKTGTMSSDPIDFKSGIVSSSGTQMAVESVVVSPAGTESKAVVNGNNTVAGTTSQAAQTSQNYGNMGNLPSRPTTQTVTSSDVAASPSPMSGTVLENGSRYTEPSSEKTGDGSHEPTSPGNPGAVVVQDVAVAAVSDTNSKAVSNSAMEVSLKGLKSLENVAELFRTYKGARTLKGFSELFDEGRYKATGFMQIPGIAVSDGKKLLTVKVSLPPNSTVPSFSLKGANLKSIRSLSDRLLELDALPQKGKLDVRLTVVIRKETAEIPLLVVPPIPETILEQSDLALEKLMAKPDPKGKTLSYDLNADGKQDYLDDYILAAHWMLKQQRDKKTPADKTAAPR